MTEKALAKLTDKQRRTLEIYKTNYIEARDNTERDIEYRHELLASYRSAISGYLTALTDTEILTQAQARLIYTYATL